MRNLKIILVFVMVLILIAGISYAARGPEGMKVNPELMDQLIPVGTTGVGIHIYNVDNPLTPTSVSGKLTIVSYSQELGGKFKEHKEEVKINSLPYSKLHGVYPYDTSLLNYEVPPELRASPYCEISIEPYVDPTSPFNFEYDIDLFKKQLDNIGLKKIIWPK